MARYNFHVDGLKDDAAEAAGVISVRALKSQKDTNADAAPDRDACVGACSDGMPPLASFIVAAHSVAKGTWYGVVDCHLHRVCTVLMSLLQVFTSNCSSRFCSNAYLWQRPNSRSRSRRLGCEQKRRLGLAKIRGAATEPRCFCSWSGPGRTCNTSRCTGSARPTFHRHIVH